jgi:hypothetical protein
MTPHQTPPFGRRPVRSVTQQRSSRPRRESCILPGASCLLTPKTLPPLQQPWPLVT